MNSPEFGPNSERLHAEELINELNTALDPVVFHMRDFARGILLNDSDKFLPPEMLDQLYEKIEATAGLPVQGELRTNKYFLPNGEVYSQRNLRHKRHGTYDFQGVLRGVGRVPVPLFRQEDKIVNQLCVVVDPLYVLADSALSTYYADRGWIDQLRQPFAIAEDQDQRIYLPIHMIDESGLQIVDHWSQ